MMSTTEQSIAERLMRLRATRGATQADVARATGITQPMIARYESGQRTPRFDTLEKLVSYYGVSMAYLTGQTDDPSPMASAVDAVVPDDLRDLVDACGLDDPVWVEQVKAAYHRPALKNLMTLALNLDDSQVTDLVTYVAGRAADAESESPSYKDSMYWPRPNRAERMLKHPGYLPQESRDEEEEKKFG